MTSVRRLGAAATVALTGAAVVAVMAVHVATAQPPMSGLLLAGFGSLVGLALVAAGVGLVWLDVSPEHALRVAGWNVLGVVVIGAALALLFAYQGAVASVPAAPVFSGTVVVAVSAVAHVLIGINDVRRIRATELARQRQKLDVLSRVVRHDLRTLAQLLYSYANRVEAAAAGDDDPEAVAAAVHEAGADLSSIHEQSKLVQDLVDGEAATRRVDLAALAGDVASDARDAHPDATVTVGVADGLAVEAGDYLRDALSELLENAVEHSSTSPDSQARQDAVEHSSTSPDSQAQQDAAEHHDGEASGVTVELSAARVAGGDRVAVSVSDDGSGIPAGERAVVTGETDVTQLDHASGLGLWVVRWVADAYGADLSFSSSEAGGTTVTLELPAAA
ncbi:sensor histidine kinase [Halobacterium rubrum]|uniref:sensor histidine kinase n=1 Tax=Halobacterium TaxID=2239 RepID=UPI001F2EA197|nr:MULTISPECIES: sensor histidine kinase [Halobacterium]MDH5019239.1 sensor histidine kinase [Halobacterium rubrum]